MRKISLILIKNVLHKNTQITIDFGLQQDGDDPSSADSYDEACALCRDKGRQKAKYANLRMNVLTFWDT